MRSLKRRLISLFLVIQLIQMFMPGIGQVSAIVVPTTVSVVPQETHSVNINQSFTVDINVSDVSDLYGYQADISFNSAVLEATLVQQGSFLVGGFSSEGTINNTAGTITNIYKSLTAGTPANGTGTLFRVTFKVIAKGSSNITISKSILSNSSATPITHSIVSGSFENNVAPSAPQGVDAQATGAPSPVDIKVTWDANSESDIAGYKVFWGLSSGPPYAHTQDVGNTTSYTIPNPGGKTYAAVKAYDSVGNESSYSTQVVACPGLALPPTAYIDSILPTSGNEGQVFTFTGHGEDPDTADHSVAGWEWSSDIDDVFGTSASTSYALSEGYHTIAFRVVDACGNWSTSTLSNVFVNDIPVAVIDSIDPNPAIAGEEVTLIGHGSDKNSITAYEWKDGTTVIGSSGTIQTSSLAVGDHTISFKVKDSNNAWSDPVTESLEITAPPTPAAPVITTPGDGLVTTASSVTVGGNSEANATITIYKGGLQVATTTASGTGNWSKTNVALDEGDNIFTAKATNQYDVTSSASNQVRVIKDTTPPAPPTISSPATGIYSTTDFTFTGTAEAGVAVKLYDGLTDKGSEPAIGGLWVLNVSGLSEGIHTFTATAWDAHDNESNASNSVILTIDLTNPTVTITDPVNGATKNSNSFEVKGTCNEDGSVKVKVDGYVKGTTPVSGGNWQIDLTDVVDGDHQILAEAQDTAGNKGTTSININVDTTLPTTPIITSPLNNSFTNNPNVTVAGTGDADSTVTVYLDDVAVLPAVSADGGGNWTKTLTGLSEGGHSIKAKATNNAGDSGFSAAVNITIDTIDPTTTLTLLPSGPDGDNGWYKTLPQITLTSNETGTTYYQWDAQTEGAWTTYTTPFTTLTGSHTLYFYSVDSAGNVEQPAKSQLIDLDIDTDMPSSTITSPADNDLINEVPVTITASASDSTSGVSTVEVSFDGGLTWPQEMTGGDGSYSATWTPAGDGSYNIKTRAKDSAGNLETPSAGIDVTVDTTAPGFPPSILQPQDGSIKNSRQITISGSNGEPGGKVWVCYITDVDDPMNNHVELFKATVAVDGSWSGQASFPSDGPYVIGAKNIDAAGNIGESCSNWVNITIDTDAPAAPVIENPITGTKTNDNTLDFSGTFSDDAESGAITITLYKMVGSSPVVVKNTTVTGGTWSLTTDALDDGLYQFIAKAKDQAGNEGPESNTVEITIDAAAPSAPVINSPINSQLFNTGNVQVSGTSEAGSMVTLDYNGDETTATAGLDSAWTITLEGLDDGVYVIKAKATDSSENESPWSATRAFTVDTVDPSTTLSLNPSGPDGDNGWYKTVPQITLTSNDTGTTYYSWVGSTGPWTTYSVPFPALTGSHTLYFYSVDSAGNVEQPAKSQLIDLDIDTEAPSSTITSPADDTLTKDIPVTITASASDSTSGISIVEVSFDGGSTWQAMSGGDGSYTFSWTPAGDGSYNIKTRAKDMAGNLETPGNGIDVVIDTTAPNPGVILAPVADSYLNSRTVVFSGTSDDPANTIRICVYADGHEKIAEADVNDNGNWQTSYTFDADGTYTINSRAVDPAGNRSDHSNGDAGITFTIDTDTPSAPEITAPADNTLTKESSFNVSGSFSDENETEALIKISVYIDGVKAGEASIIEGTWSLGIGPLTDGDYVLTAKAQDKAGNVSEVSNAVNVTVDKVCELNVTEPVNGSYTNDNTATVTGSTETGASVSINGVPATVAGNGGFSESVTLNEGTNHIMIEATDAAGNTARFELTVYLDTQAPGAIDDLDAGSPTSNSIPLSWTAPADNLIFGEYDLRYSTAEISDPDSFATASKAGGLVQVGTAGSSEAYILTGLAASTKYFMAIRTMDKAGNWSGISNIETATTNAAPSGGGGGGGGATSPAPSGSMTGQVLDRFGNPVLTATITGDGSSAAPGSDGRFAMTLPEGDHLVLYSAPGYDSQTQWLHITGGQTTQAPTCILTQAGGLQVAQENLGEIFGRVVNTAMQPIPGTAVRINNVVIPTNPGGHFRFTLVHPGIYTIYYDAPGYIGQTQVIEVKAGQTTNCPTVLLSRAANSQGTIKGKVVNTSNRPIKGVFVRIDNTVMITNAKGEFRFTGVHSGVYVIHYDAVGYNAQTQMIEAKPGQVVTTPKVIMSR